MSFLTGLKGLAMLAATASIAPLASYAQDYTFRLAHVTSDQEPIQQAMEQFAANVTERTEGRVAIQIFPNAQLGSNPEVYEQMRTGAPIITISDPGFLSDFVPDFGVLGGPYLMEDPRDFQKIVDSELYANLIDQLRADGGIELLALNWFFGARHMIADRPISGADDIAGMSFRTPENIMWTETFLAMGARPTTLAWAEVYSALGSGVVDGAEAPLPSIYGARLHEARPIISLTGHFKGFTGLIMNADTFAALPEDIQTILSEEATSAGVYMTDLMLTSQEEWIAKLEAEGATVNREVDVAAFQEMTAGVYTKFPAWSDGLYEEVRATLDN
ncbi:MAG: C4-dicarboxylate TRAP transporter substrate-binding protein [Paracoccaceae bacterium]